MTQASPPFQIRAYMSGIQMPFEYQTIYLPDSFKPFDYRTD